MSAADGPGPGARPLPAPAAEESGGPAGGRLFFLVLVRGFFVGAGAGTGAARTTGAGAGGDDTSGAGASAAGGGDDTAGVGAGTAGGSVGVGAAATTGAGAGGDDSAGAGAVAGGGNAGGGELAGVGGAAAGAGEVILVLGFEGGAAGGVEIGFFLEEEEEGEGAVGEEVVGGEAAEVAGEGEMAAPELGEEVDGAAAGDWEWAVEAASRRTTTRGRGTKKRGAMASWVCVWQWSESVRDSASWAAAARATGKRRPHAQSSLLYWPE